MFFNGFYHDTKILAEQDKERKESYISFDFTYEGYSFKAV